MIEIESKSSKKPSQRRFSDEEKRNYCIAWDKSELTQLEFCKAQGISKSVLNKWYKTFKEEGGGKFSPVILGKESMQKREEQVGVEIRFSNEIRLSLAIHLKQLRELIEEVSYAAAIIR